MDFEAPEAPAVYAAPPAPASKPRTAELADARADQTWTGASLVVLGVVSFAGTAWTADRFHDAPVRESAAPWKIANHTLFVTGGVSLAVGSTLLVVPQLDRR